MRGRVMDRLRPVLLVIDFLMVFKVKLYLVLTDYFPIVYAYFKKLAYISAVCVKPCSVGV